MELAWTRPGAYCICRDEAGRILLTRFEKPGELDSGKWTMPGGGQDWLEQPAETAARELMEETGLAGEIGPLVDVFSTWFPPEVANSGTPGQALCMIFEARNLHGELKSDFSDDDTTDEAQWFTLAEARQLPRVPLVDFVLGLIAQH